MSLLQTILKRYSNIKQEPNTWACYNQSQEKYYNIKNESNTLVYQLPIVIKVFKTRH